MDRLDHPNYFQINFNCPDIENVFVSLTSKKSIRNKKNLINIFYNRMISIEKLSMCFYVRLKWIVYQHSLLSKYGDRSALFQYTLKALMMYSENFDEVSAKFGPY